MILPRSASIRAVVAAAACLVIGTMSASAHAFCREITQTQPAAEDPAYTGVCFKGDGAGVFDVYWKNRCVGYSLQKDASKQVTLEQATRVAAQAFSAWSDAACSGGAPSIKAEAESPVECAKAQYNCDGPNQHAIIFHDDVWPYPGDRIYSLAFTTVTYDATDGEIFDADMEINSSDHTIVADGTVPDAGPDGGAAYDLRSIMTHEAGHFLGLAHSPLKDAVMYAFYQPGSTSLTPDDVSGICSIYSPDGTRNTSLGPVTADACDDTPRHGFTSMCGQGDTGDCTSLVEGGAGEGGGGDGNEVGSSRGGCTSSPVTPGAQTSLPFALLGLLGGGFFMRRRRLVAARSATAALGIALASTMVVTTVAGRDARASVSIAALFDELVRDSSAVGIVTPVEQRSVWEDGRIYTYTRMHVESRVAGELPRDPWVRTMGGIVGRVGQRVEGEAVLTPGQPSLLFLHAQIDPETRAPLESLEVTARGQGQFPVLVGDDHRPRLAGGASVGGLLPPTSDRLARVTQPPRFARDVLALRFVDDATNDIAAAWTRLHAQPPPR